MNCVRLLTRLIAACSAALLLACGQKGPLTLPDKSAAVVTTPQATATPPTPAATPPDKTKDKDKNADSQPPQ